MSYNQPGPYGQQPQQPGPYGQGGAAGQPGYGYPPQAPAGQPNPYAQPQAPQSGPYGQQPGQPGPYGQPQQPGPYGQPQPPVPPQGGGNKTKTIAVVSAAVVVVGAIVTGVVLLTGGDDDGKKGGKAKDDPKVTVPGGNGGTGGSGLKNDGPHKLATPQTVLTEYKLQGNDSGTEPLSSSDLRKLGMKGSGTGVKAEYSTLDLSGSKPDSSQIASAKFLSLFGAYGPISDPQKALDAFFKEIQEQSVGDKDAELVGSPEAQSPDGLDGAVMKCQVIKAKQPQPGMASSFPMCAWADHSTVAAITFVKPLGAPTIPEAAKNAADLRKEIRVPQ